MVKKANNTSAVTKSKTVTKTKAAVPKRAMGRPAAGRSATVSKASYAKPVAAGKSRMKQENVTPRQRK